MARKEILKARELKEILTYTIRGTREGTVEVKTANSIAGGTRAFLQVIKTEIMLQKSKATLSQQVKSFTD